jgi:poly-gamma-glutamate synthesis protein (capsule biosynthesis protein)
VRELLAADDLTIVNFEGVLTNSAVPGNNNTYQFREDPAHAQVLTLGSVEAVALENNHVRDFGELGYSDTVAALEGAGIVYSGNGHLGVYEVSGVRVGMLAYQTFGGVHEQVLEQATVDIAAAREAGCAVVIVSFHWGNELDYKPNDRQIWLGRATIDAGADLVLGHHSHRINPIELYNGRYIVYSLANFSFSGNSLPKDMDTFLFQVKFSVENGAAQTGPFRIVPMRISSRTDTNDFAPTSYKAGSTAFKRVIDRMTREGRNLKYAVESYPTEWE